MLRVRGAGDTIGEVHNNRRGRSEASRRDRANHPAIQHPYAHEQRSRSLENVGYEDTGGEIEYDSGRLYRPPSAFEYRPEHDWWYEEMEEATDDYLQFRPIRSRVTIEDCIIWRNSAYFRKRWYTNAVNVWKLPATTKLCARRHNVMDAFTQWRYRVFLRWFRDLEHCLHDSLINENMLLNETTPLMIRNFYESGHTVQEVRAKLESSLHLRLYL